MCSDIELLGTTGRVTATDSVCAGSTIVQRATAICCAMSEKFFYAANDNKEDNWLQAFRQYCLFTDFYFYHYFKICFFDMILKY